MLNIISTNISTETCIWNIIINDENICDINHISLFMHMSLQNTNIDTKCLQDLSAPADST
jgi:hypothetical protein